MKRRLIAGTINRYPAEKGWENVHLDKSPRPLYDLERRRFGTPAEIVAGFEELLEDEHLELAGSFDEVRCWQALEHLPPKVAPVALRGFRRVLKPGGVLDVEVPNVEAVVLAWIEGELPRDDALANIYGSATKLADDHLNAHRWGYTPVSLRELLHAEGFRGITQIDGKAPVVAPLRYRAESP
jgi:SAM-dependent methyltransferase